MPRDVFRKAFLHQQRFTLVTDFERIRTLRSGKLTEHLQPIKVTQKEASTAVPTDTDSQQTLLPGNASRAGATESLTVRPITPPGFGDEQARNNRYTVALPVNYTPRCC